jgi:hypothetical protein
MAIRRHDGQERGGIRLVGECGAECLRVGLQAPFGSAASEIIEEEVITVIATPLQQYRGKPTCSV